MTQRSPKKRGLKPAARVKRVERVKHAKSKLAASVPKSREPKSREPEPRDGMSLRRPVEPEIGPMDDFRTGYVALIGRPNVGKSTILNQLLDQKIAATSHKPQTTRKNVLGILHPKGAQVLLLDTPGYHQAEGPLNRYMIKQTKTAIADADVIGYVIEAREDGAITSGNEQIIAQLQKTKKPVVLLVNKIDRVKAKQALLPQAEAYGAALKEQLAAVVPISALRKKGLEAAVKELAHALPRGVPLHGEDELTDQSERAIVSEMVREKVVLETHEELPYATAVTIDSFEDGRPGLVRIFATIHVEKESQKGIVIGRGGSLLKVIGTRARKDIEHFLGARVFLDLKVRMTESWSKLAPALEMLGYGREGRLGSERAPEPLELPALEEEARGDER